MHSECVPPEKRVNENKIMLVAAYLFGLRKGTFKETSDFGLIARSSLFVVPHCGSLDLV